ncbi:DUF4198 domain-containing protein [Indioceanicola profundi]|uniref:DUF4198 domain-containing protein n=1 Tax=Indioceanicola profundi TaxID=2220096 RepID=UPI000E6ABA1D|nr:DUF4198 domain-containing protein [Indioceanicola profundi]
MKTLTKAILAGTVVAGLVAPTLAQAHGIWFAERARQLALIYGVGADDLDTVRRLPLVETVAGYGPDWQPVKTELRAAGPIVVVDREQPTIAVSAVMNNGVWSKTADGQWHKKGRDEVPEAVLSERTLKYAVHLTAPLNGPMPVLPDQTLQVVPVEGKLPEQMGTPVTLRVLFQGKPVAGALVHHDFVNDPDQERLKTDADGTVTLKVRNQGLNVIGATYVGPSDDKAKYDKIEYFATLSFVLPHLPE